MDRVPEPEVMDTPEEAAAYDAMDHAEVNAAFVDRLVGLGARGRMLDIGCGPGHIPLLVAERVPGSTLVAVDLAPAMLALARRRLDDSPHRDRIPPHLDLELRDRDPPARRRVGEGGQNPPSIAGDDRLV